MVAPDPLARPVPNGRNRHDGKEPTQVASARRLPLCGATDQMRLTQIVASNPLRATRFGEADGRTAPLLSETENAPSNTTQPHCGEGVVRGTARGRPSSAALRDLPTTRLCRVLSVRMAPGRLLTSRKTWRPRLIAGLEELPRAGSRAVAFGCRNRARRSPAPLEPVATDSTAGLLTVCDLNIG